MQRIINFIKEKHKNQEYQDLPYYFHLKDVARIGNYFKLREEQIIACYLHDIKEDTDTTNEEILLLLNNNIELFEKVIEIIDLVTDKPGKNRNERHKNTYPLLAKNKKAVDVKLCDRISNLKFSYCFHNYKKLNMYISEHEGFKNYLFNEKYNNKRIWNKYDKNMIESKKLLKKKNA